MSAPTLSVVTWNIQWKTSGSGAAALMRERLLACEPEVVCITEGYTDFFGSEGHLIEAEADYGYPLVPGRRKVMLWSRQPWTAVDQIGHSSLPSGRFVAGTTRTSIGEITVVGVCVPWRDAHVSTGRRDRKRWQDHVAYLGGLQEYLAALHERAIALGDYNQRIPRAYVPVHVHQVLIDCLGDGLSVATTGPVEPTGAAVIDHVAHTADLQAREVATLSNIGADGGLLSDHLGVKVNLAW